MLLECTACCCLWNICIDATNFTVCIAHVQVAQKLCGQHVQHRDLCCCSGKSSIPCGGSRQSFVHYFLQHNVSLTCLLHQWRTTADSDHTAIESDPCSLRQRQLFTWKEWKADFYFQFALRKSAYTNLMWCIINFRVIYEVLVERQI